MKIIITAPPKTGKSTLLKKLAEILPNAKGILTHQVLAKNETRIGFQSAFIGSNTVIPLALKGEQSNCMVGNYSVDTKNLEICAQYLGRLSGENPIIIDEIGRMQAFSKNYLDVAYKLLTSDDNFVIASLVYGDEEFALRFRNIPGVEYIELTFENRQKLPQLIYEKYLISK